MFLILRLGKRYRGRKEDQEHGTLILVGAILVGGERAARQREVVAPPLSSAP
jgi:hypothetical protein